MLYDIRKEKVIILTGSWYWEKVNLLEENGGVGRS
jgi:hypothetical protein